MIWVVTWLEVMVPYESKVDKGVPTPALRVWITFRFPGRLHCGRPGLRSGIVRTSVVS